MYIYIFKAFLQKINLFEVAKTGTEIPLIEGRLHNRIWVTGTDITVSMAIKITGSSTLRNQF